MNTRSKTNVKHGLFFVLQEMTALPDYVQFKHFVGSDFKDIFTAATDDVLDLLRALLHVDPNQRSTCQQVDSILFISSPTS